MILPHTLLLELDQGRYRLYLRMTVFGRFIKLPILLIAFIVYLITAISLCPIEIDLDRPYILLDPSFANLKLI